ncbi:unnamed protein product [Rotaria sordida]|uniref:Uncharacterized protein n=1 Tax=Rotaria sordida TaxID=392033 RepID=A0A819T4M9_9BILA|nr:unnamed protein product [Rotaria sordida]
MTDRYKCSSNKIYDGLCIHRRFLNDKEQDCQVDNADELFPIYCTDEFSCQYLRQLNLQQSQIPIIYEELCNGFEIINRNLINVETDETNCDDWPCNSHGSYCDGIWNRPNGCDELDCPNTIPSFIARHVANCSSNEHYCLQYNSSKINCLPVTKANDGIFDCLFGSDERHNLRRKNLEILMHNAYVTSRSTYFNQSLDETIDMQQICNREIDCLLEDDELLCLWHTYSLCSYDEFTCKNEMLFIIHIIHPFSFNTFNSSKNQQEHGSISRTFLPFINKNHDKCQCHRGILIKDIDIGGFRCLCPPTYFGIQYQYQSERLTISFHMKILTTFDLKIIYQLIFYLIDQQENLLTVESLIYVPIIHSLKKHFITFVYPRRNQSISSFGNLSVYIDAYIITTNIVEHSLSWFYPVQFSFLAVNPLAIRLFTEERSINLTKCAQLNCKHGICQSFINIDQ